MENPIKMDELGVPPFSETLKSFDLIYGIWVGMWSMETKNLLLLREEGLFQKHY